MRSNAIADFTGELVLSSSLISSHSLYNFLAREYGGPRSVNITAFSGEVPHSKNRSLAYPDSKLTLLAITILGSGYFANSL